MSKRLFLALNLPGEIKIELQALVAKLKKINNSKPIKWVEEDNFHLTLHFLGDVPEEKIEAINKALEPIVNKYSSPNFQLTTEINAFPDLNNPKVIFLEIEELNGGQSIAMQKETGQALAKLGFEIDPRPFRLHLTLGRVKFKTSIQIPKFEISNLKFKIPSIDLMSSDLTPSGPIYNIIKKYNLSL